MMPHFLRHALAKALNDRAFLDYVCLEDDKSILKYQAMLTARGGKPRKPKAATGGTPWKRLSRLKHRWFTSASTNATAKGTGYFSVSVSGKFSVFVSTGTE